MLPDPSERSYDSVYTKHIILWHHNKVWKQNVVILTTSAMLHSKNAQVKKNDQHIFIIICKVTAV